MDYIKDNLIKDEKITSYTKPHWVIFLKPCAFILTSILFLVEGANMLIFNQQAVFLRIPTYVLIALVFLFLAIYTGLQALIYYHFSEYGITNKRILIKIGWIRRYSFEIFLKRVEGIEVNQTIPGRFLNYGTVVIRGIGGSRDYFPFVPKPIFFRKKAQSAIDQVNA